ncbi:SDR family NAD(P)-dependent oxidoreductase [Arthrobacter sp. zg-Y1219]|uniref:SDR family NAD(P)-dependent oxidoreductase n=1 Tax=Arthrobacter sp. zg-Y1219 TaxID=3049067 RepID=UPI0024C3D79A|nr:SDR family NAD(P)-dependent oxidoreductase [Arthrobacter sp. zg-Y1219]MDK1361138.1 SDR family NAD(P)-dependent oxidoreductase [Arthrobacter sp. zg-Y1219]
MARVLVTGSTDGIGRSTAMRLLEQGHDVVVHARTPARLSAVRDLIERGAGEVVGDLSRFPEVREFVAQANGLGRFDAVIHNAGTMNGSSVLPVNVVAPYVLTAEMERPGRLIYLSSGMHHGGRPDLAGIDWSGSRATRSYSNSKLFVTTLMAAVARLWPDVLAHALDPGWVPTRMGGPSAPDDLSLADVTQVWLATTEDPAAMVSGRYWFHQEPRAPHPAVHDEGFQNDLLASLAAYTGVALAGP